MLLFIILLLKFSILPLSGAMESGIVGGKESKPHSRPYMVSFQQGKQHCCTGMLVKNDFVLTTAHCVDDKKCSDKEKLNVLLGAHNINQKENSQQRIQVKEYIKHPSYKPGQYLNDVMLLKLTTKAKLTKNVNLISLPNKDKNIPANQYCIVAGWGMKKPNGTASNVLNEVSLKIQFNFECKHKWQKYFDPQHMICSVSDGKKAFCQGDSGGPLICNKKLVGMASYTFNGSCLNPKYPEVYMKISSYLPWIRKVIVEKNS